MIAAGKNDVELEVRIPAGFASSAPLTFGIAGKATIGNGEVIARASTLAALKKLFPRLPASTAGTGWIDRAWGQNVTEVQ